MAKRAPLLCLAILLYCIHCASAAVEPVFVLDFSNGLNASAIEDSVSETVEGTWTGRSAPEYYEPGLSGSALLITDNGPDSSGWDRIGVRFETPENTRGSGSLTFWIRGLENWDLWGRGNNRNLWPTVLFYEAGGEGGGIWLYKWNWHGSPTYLAHPGAPTARAATQLGGFDQYVWNQVGFTWQSESAESHSKRVRVYLNGRKIDEFSEIFPFNSFWVGGNPALSGPLTERTFGSRLLDSVRIWDTPLTDSQLKRLHRLEYGLVNSPLVSLPFLSRPPVIDGEVQPDEWSGAAVVKGLLRLDSGEVAEDKSSFMLGYDNEYLYIAMSGDMTAEAKSDPAVFVEKFLLSEHTSRDRGVADDDTVEILLSPLYWQAENRLTPGDWTEYRLIVNADGGYYGCIHDITGRDETWAPQFSSASSVSNERWEFEARIPLLSFGVKPSAGEEWGLQLGRIWRHLKEQHDTWSWGRRFTLEPTPERNAGIIRPPEDAPPVPYQPDTLQSMHMHQDGRDTNYSMGRMVFLPPDSPFVRIESIGEPGRQLIDLRAVIVNPSLSDVELSIAAYTDTGEISVRENMAAKAGSEVEYSINHYISDFSTSVFNFEVYNMSGERLHRTSLPFYLEQSFSVQVKQRPNLEEFLVQLDLGIFSDIQLEEIGVDIIITDAGGNNVYSKTGLGLDSYISVIKGDTRGFDYGSYSMKIDINREGERIASEELEFVKLGKSSWWDARLGYEDTDNDKVPYPWEDMSLKDNAVNVWGRSYDYGGSFLPEQINILGRPLLRAPIRLVVETSDGGVLDTALSGSSVEWKESMRTRVSGDISVNDDGIQIVNSLKAEYDGMVWNSISVMLPQGTALKSMIIEAPISAEFTDVIKAGRDPRRNPLGLIKPEGHKNVGGCWLGNGDGGIQFLPSGMRADVLMEDGSATVRFTLPDNAEPDGGIYKVGLDFAATPMRPKTWRTFEFHPDIVRGGGPFYPDTHPFLPAPDPDGIGYGGRQTPLYVFTSTVGVNKDASSTDCFADYGAEWLTDPFSIRPGSSTISPAFTKSFQDWFVWRYWRYQDKYGFRGLYYDNPGIGRDVMKRLYHVTLSNPYFGAREQQIGLASNSAYNVSFAAFATYQWNGEHLNSVLGGGDTYHGILDPAVFRAEFMGHNWGWPARLLGQWRVRPEAAEDAGGREAVEDHVDGLVLLHDTALPYMMPCCIVRREVRPRVERTGLAGAIEKHNFYHWKYQFTPYWRQDMVVLPSEDMYASFYIARPSLLTSAPADYMGMMRRYRSYFKMFDHLPHHMKVKLQGEMAKEMRMLERMRDKAVMVVYNDSEWEGEMRLKVDWGKLGLGSPDILTVENAVHSPGFPIAWEEDAAGKEVKRILESPNPPEYARIEGDEVVFPMTRYNYRMIVIEQVNP